MTKDKTTAFDRLRYRFDNIMSAGTGPVMIALGIATAALIITAGLIIAAAGVVANGQRTGIVEAIWLSLLRTLDPGTMGGDTGWAFRLVSFGVTLGGIFIVSALISLLTSGIDNKLQHLRKGRTRVVETRHTLILGWSAKLFPILSELAIANRNQPSSCVVILADQDKAYMEDEIRARVVKPRRMRIVCRTGDPADPNSLTLVQATKTKSVIVLCANDDSADAQVIKTILALLNQDPQLERLRIVAEMTDMKNAQAIRRATGEKVLTVVSTDVIGKITAQVCRQRGLSVVYGDLMDFDGDEIYFREEPALVGKTLGESLLLFEDSSIIGIRRSTGELQVKPDLDTVIGPGDQVIGISADDDTLVLSKDPMVPASLGPLKLNHQEEQGAERILILGWNVLGPLILKQLDNYVAPDSEVSVVYDPTFAGRREIEHVATLKNMGLKMSEGDTTDLAVLSSAFTDRPFRHVILLCYRGVQTVAESDARTLMTLLQLRHLLQDLPVEYQPESVVTEMLDVRDVELARMNRADDFIVSERLTSLMLAQLAENPELDQVFEDLFDAAGVEVSLRPAASYVPTGVEISFAQAVVAASERQDIAIGFRIGADAGEPHAGVTLNPPKHMLVTFTDQDQLLVLTSLPVTAAGILKA